MKYQVIHFLFYEYCTVNCVLFCFPLCGWIALEATKLNILHEALSCGREPRDPTELPVK